MHILLPSDTFPPGNVGGAAWSVSTLAVALARQGHTVDVVVPVYQAPALPTPTYPDSLTVHYWRYNAPCLPFVQNYYRHERLWSPLADWLVQLGQQSRSDRLLIHAQHVQVAPAAVLAGQQLGVPVVVTVRDHWPWDYFATGLHSNRLPLPPRPALHQRIALQATDLLARLGPGRGSAALVALPYMLAHMRRRAAFLARADVVIAVSRYIRNRLAHQVPAQRLRVLPNMVDIDETQQIATTAPQMPPQIDPQGPFLLYIGKLERNKGAHLLVDVFRALRTQEPDLPLPPLLLAGTGALRASLQRELAALNVSAHFLGWVAHEEIVRLQARCTALLFPSAWGEPLSRVLLEASALGAPVLAMPTGGTPDIIHDGHNGLLAATPSRFAACLVWLLQHPTERERLGENARQDAARRFAVEAVRPQVEHLYDSLLAWHSSSQSLQAMV